MEIKLGLKLPPIDDKRTIKLSTILKPELLPALPEVYYVDEALGGTYHSHMFGNDQYGCCVISEQAHHTLRFEKFEQDKVIPITDEEVIQEYLRQTGNKDSGLYMMLALKEWRNRGWSVSNKIYNIYAFASVDWLDHDEVKYCIYLLNGLAAGMRVYEQDKAQFEKGEIWHITGDPGRLLGGHAIYFNKFTNFNSYGLSCITWGKQQDMTWSFFNMRLQEAYGIVDDQNKWMTDDSPVDVEKLNKYLEEITGESGEPEIPCPIARFIVRKFKDGIHKRWF